MTNVLVMNNNTLEETKEELLETASYARNPIGFITDFFKDLEIVVDDSLSDQVIEYWDKNSYERMKKELGDM
ncbi:hypothetical protein [Bacillus stercoris]|uniref:hypothetical protein n=1 Tax=Bacillus stercoris TaxID=2054641 RepID=UPI003CEEFC5F